MIQKEIECYVDYFNDKEESNIEIYHLFGGGWDSRSLASCINCTELFVYDEQNLFFKNVTLKQSTIGYQCPKCKIELDKTIQKYPDTFKSKNNIILHFKIPEIINIEKFKKIKIKVWDLFNYEYIET